MMDENARELCLLWDAVEEFIPQNERRAAAVEFVAVMADLRAGIETLYEAGEDNEHLEAAIGSFLDDNDPEIEDDDHDQEDD